MTVFSPHWSSSHCLDHLSFQYTMAGLLIEPIPFLQGCTYTTICLYCRYTIILVIRSAVPIPIFMAGCINLHDNIVRKLVVIIVFHTYLASLCTCMPATCMQNWTRWNWAFCGVANRSSAVWRYFSITDEGKATCKICEQAVSPGEQKKARLLRDLDVVILEEQEIWLTVRETDSYLRRLRCYCSWTRTYYTAKFWLLAIFLLFVSSY